MTVENTGAALARQANEALRRLDDEGRSMCPDGVDRFTWSAEVLDELARLAETIGRAVEQVSGESASDAQARARALATTIVAHRNSLLRLEDGPRPSPGSGDLLAEATAAPARVERTTTLLPG